MRDIREREFRGAKFKFVATELNASYFTFDDEQEVRDLWWHIKPGDVVLDVGAGFGSYALPALALGAEVIVFSPFVEDTCMLAANLEVNPEFTARCKVIAKGLHSRPGWFDPDHAVFGDHRSDFPTDRHRALLEVDVLDEMMALPRVDWMKLDVEGAELDVLAGARHTIIEHKPKLIIENHLMHDPNMATKVAAMVDSFGLGYTCVTRPHHAISHSYFEMAR